MAANLTLESAVTTRATRHPRARFFSLRAAVDVWSRRAEARRQLSQLSDRMLRDVGFDPETARREAAKPFWKPYTLTPSSDV